MTGCWWCGASETETYRSGPTTVACVDEHACMAREREAVAALEEMAAAMYDGEERR